MKLYLIVCNVEGLTNQVNVRKTLPEAKSLAVDIAAEQCDSAKDEIRPRSTRDWASLPTTATSWSPSTKTNCLGRTTRAVSRSGCRSWSRSRPTRGRWTTGTARLRPPSGRSSST